MHARPAVDWQIISYLSGFRFSADQEGALLFCRCGQSDHALQPLVEQHVTQRLAEVVSGVLEVTAAADGDAAPNNSGSNTTDGQPQVRCYIALNNSLE